MFNENMHLLYKYLLSQPWPVYIDTSILKLALERLINCLYLFTLHPTSNSIAWRQKFAASAFLCAFFAEPLFYRMELTLKKDKVEGGLPAYILQWHCVSVHKLGRLDCEPLDYWGFPNIPASI